MIECLNISRMPGWHLYFGLDNDCYGDVVIWIGPLYVSWNWRKSRSQS